MATENISQNLKSEHDDDNDHIAEKESEERTCQSTRVSEDTDEKKVKESEFVDGDDNEFTNSDIQVISLNQKNDVEHSHYLILRTVWENGEQIPVVTTDGAKEDKKAVWQYHFTRDINLARRVVMLENIASSKKKGKPCVLCVAKNDNNQYVLTAKNITRIPENLESADSDIIFFQKPRVPGSSISFFESALSSTDKQLLIGFDSSGKPLPLEEVQFYSRYYEAYFRIVQRFNSD